MARWRECSEPMTLPGPGPARRTGWRCRGGRSRGWPAPGCRAASGTPVGAVEGLDLGLLVHAEHQRPLGRVEIEPDDVADLGHEQRILGQLPRILFVRCESERPPDPRDHRLAQAQVLGHRPRRPMRGIQRGALQRRGDQRLDLLIAYHPRPAGTGLIEQAITTIFDEPVAPPLDRRPGDSHPHRHVGVGLTFGGRQYDSRPQCQPRRTRPAPRPPLQLGTFSIGQHDHGSLRTGHDPVYQLSRN